MIKKMAVNIHRVDEQGNISKSYKTITRIENIRQFENGDIEITEYFGKHIITMEDHHIEVFI